MQCSLKGARKTILRGYGTEEYHGNVVFRRCGPPPDCAAVRREAEAGCEIALTATVADDILQRVARPLRALGIKCSCPGGGRIRHGVQELFVYGYSQVRSRPPLSSAAPAIACIVCTACIASIACIVLWCRIAAVSGGTVGLRPGGPCACR